MNLMEDTTTYSELEEKYKKFVVPTIKMKIDGKEVQDVLGIITSLTIKLSCISSEKNILTFSTSGLYNFQSQSFDGTLIDTTFKLGAPIDVEIGYIATVPLFNGYIDGIQYDLDVEEGINVSITCLDFKGLLSNKKGDAKRKGGNRCAEVKNIVNHGDYSSYASLNSGGGTFFQDMEADYEKKEKDGKVSDFHSPTSTELDKVSAMADRYGYYFFVFYNKVYFIPKDKPTSTSIMTLTPKDGILSANIGFSLSELISGAEVRAENHDELQMLSSKVAATISSSITTNTAALGYELVFDVEICSETDAGNKAQGLIDNNRWEAAAVTVTTVGIPEIVPGRFIKLDELSTKLNKKVFIMNVTHQINRDDGYKTTFSGRIKME